MSNLIKKNNNSIIPKKIADMTLEELMSSNDVEIHKKDNVLKMKRITESEIISIEVRSYDDTTTVLKSQTHRDKPVSHMSSTIAQMRKEGKTQAEVAYILGTTQTNISKIEKKMKQGR